MLSVARRATPRIARPLALCCRFNSTAAAAPAAAAAAEGSPAASAAPVDPKIASIVASISQLTIMETSQLISELKTQLNIPDIAPMAPMGAVVGGAGAAGGAAAAGDAAAEEAPKEEEKTTFSLKLESFDAKSKAKIIKEIKSSLGLSLVEAKKFVESAPKVIKDNIAKADAEAMKETLEKLGAKVSME